MATYRPKTAVKYTILANRYMQLAANHCDAVREIESTRGSRKEIRLAHFNHCVSALIFLSAFLEAVVNESLEFPQNISTQTSAEFSRAIEEFKKASPRASILTKAQFVVGVRGNPFDRGKSPLQEVTAVLNLRNLYVHASPKPLVYDFETDLPMNLQSVEKQMEPFKLAENPFMKEKNEPYFPDRCLSSALCDWAFQSVMNFVNTFFVQAELSLPFYLKPAANTEA